MTQVSKYPLNKALHTHILDALYQTIVKLSDKKRVEGFLNDFLTPTEKIMLAKRLAIFIMLSDGYSYEIIRETLKVSPPTIAAASRYYKYLGRDGREIVDEIVRDKRFSQVWFTMLEKVVSQLAKVRKGSSSWRALQQEIRKKKETSKLL